MGLKKDNGRKDTKPLDAYQRTCLLCTAVPERHEIYRLQKQRLLFAEPFTLQWRCY